MQRIRGHPSVSLCISLPEEHADQDCTNGTKRVSTDPEVFRCDDERIVYKDYSLYNYLYEPLKCVPPGWEEFFQMQKVKDQIQKIADSLKGPGIQVTFEPPMIYLFNAFRKVPAHFVQVVIVGQDPTPTAGQATGMAFSAWPSTPPHEVPPTIMKILGKVHDDGYLANPYNSLKRADLTMWAEQGVFLLNSALTITQGDQDSSDIHQRIWREFTKLLVEYLDKPSMQRVWIFWGAKAQYFAQFVKYSQFVLTGVHPSPNNPNLKEFFTVPYFKCANFWQAKMERPQINWSLNFQDRFDSGIDETCERMKKSNG